LKFRYTRADARDDFERQTYSMGLELFNAGKVKKITVEQETLSAIVTDGDDHELEAQISLEGGQISLLSWRCTCEYSAFECAHQAAATLAFIEGNKRGDFLLLPAVSNSRVNLIEMREYIALQETLELFITVMGLEDTSYRVLEFLAQFGQSIEQNQFLDALKKFEITNSEGKYFTARSLSQLINSLDTNIVEMDANQIVLAQDLRVLLLLAGWSYWSKTPLRTLLYDSYALRDLENNWRQKLVRLPASQFLSHTLRLSIERSSTRSVFETARRQFRRDQFSTQRVFEMFQDDFFTKPDMREWTLKAMDFEIRRLPYRMLHGQDSIEGLMDIFFGICDVAEEEEFFCDEFQLRKIELDFFHDPNFLDEADIQDHMFSRDLLERMAGYLIADSGVNNEHCLLTNYHSNGILKTQLQCLPLLDGLKDAKNYGLKVDGYLQGVLRNNFHEIVIQFLRDSYKDNSTSVSKAEEIARALSLLMDDENCSFNIAGIMILFELYLFHNQGQETHHTLSDIATTLYHSCASNHFWLLQEYFRRLTTRLGGEDLIAPQYAEINSNLVLEWVPSSSDRGLAQLNNLHKLLTQPEEEKTLVNWRLGFKEGRLQAIPFVKKRKKDGEYTKGQRITLREFRYTWSYNFSYLDRQIALAVESQESYSCNDSVSMRLVGPLLQQHQWVSLMEDPHQMLKLKEVEPELIVNRCEGGDFELTLLPQGRWISPELVSLSEDTLGYLFADEKKQKLIDELRSGVQVPGFCKDELAPVLQLLSKEISLEVNHQEGAINDPLQLTPGIKIHRDRNRLDLEWGVCYSASHQSLVHPSQSGASILLFDDAGEMQSIARSIELEREMLGPLQELFTRQGFIHDENRNSLTLDTLQFLDIYDQLLQWQSDGELLIFWPKGKPVKEPLRAEWKNLKLFAESKNNWFEFQVGLPVDEGKVLAIDQFLKRGDGELPEYIQLDESQFLKLSEDFRKKSQEMHSFYNKQEDSFETRGPKLLAFDNLASELEVYEASGQWQKTRDEIESLRKFEATLPDGLQAQLRPYQIQGYRWLCNLAQLGFGACLADEMGLGKTLQTIALLLKNKEQGCFLVVCPTSVVYNWKRECESFAPDLEVDVFNPRESIDLKKTYHDSAGRVLIISYALLVRHCEKLEGIHFHTVVLDEAQAIKNRESYRSISAKLIPSKFRIALSGTPIENRLEELFSIFEFVNPGLLGSISDFKKRYLFSGLSEGVKEARIKSLSKLIQPYLLRRTKEQVLTDLPAKIEIDHFVEASPRELAFYEALRRNALEEIEGSNSPQARFAILAQLMRLRRACCNPRLIDESLKISSSKEEAFYELLEQILSNGDRVLVFSQFVAHLQLIEAGLKKRKVSYQYLDGSTKPRQREQRVKAFQEGEGEVFLISLKAGGTGLNLTGANYVIHLDPWWNPAVEDQASDRAHRIGQSKTVTVYRLLMRNTIEDKINALHKDKRDLADSVIQGDLQDGSLSMDELIDLIQG